MEDNGEIFTFFQGEIFHKRFLKKIHFFKNFSLFLMIDLTKISNNKNSFTKPKLNIFSINKLNLVSWYCRDHGERKKNSKPKDLVNFVNKISKQNFKKIKLFCFPKILGFGFNPLSIYYCYDKSKLTQTIFEVKNTFGDMHHYILKSTDKYGLKQFCKKNMFVSPFFENRGFYELHAKYIYQNVNINIKYIVDKKLYLIANVKAKKINLSELEIIKNLIKLKMFPAKNWILIHLEAIKLWIKKIQIYEIPKKNNNQITYAKLKKNTND